MQYTARRGIHWAVDAEEALTAFEYGFQGKKYPAMAG